MSALADQLNSERKAWKAEIVRGRTNTLLWIARAGGLGYAAGR
jgi:hypothetical protein